jgi:hypothetical protein
VNNSTDSNSNSIEIISVHVPKTAGATFGHVILPQIYGQERIFYDYESLPVEVLQTQIKSEYKVVHGHFPAVKYISKYPNAKIIVWLRNPINFLISWYYFWLTFPTDAPTSSNFHKYVVNNKLCFEDFIEFPKPQNSISRYYLKGIKLEDLYFVGIQEFFREDLRELQNLLNWPEVKVTPSNRNRYHDYESRVRDILKDRRLIGKIASLNSADMELYQNALNLRAKRKGLSNSLEQYQVCLQESQQRLQTFQFTNSSTEHQENILRISLEKALLSRKHRLLLLWSAKAGCTFAVKWFLHHEGLLQESLNYSPWVHNYRQDIFYNKVNYRQLIENPLEILNSQKLTIVKVVRNPYTRAVSSYLHASKHLGLSQPILAFLNKSDHEKFSFREFVDYLESINLEDCNIHWEIQQSPAEKVETLPIHRIIKLEESQIALKELEIELNLKSADIILLRESNHHTIEIENSKDYCSDSTDFKTEGAILYRPPYKKFYDLELQQRIFDLYKNDFVAYGYSENYRYELD